MGVPLPALRAGLIEPPSAPGYRMEEVKRYRLKTRSKIM